MNGSSLKRNLLGNLVGRGYASLVNFVVTPLYLRLLGEGYGLIGLFITLLAVVSLLDMGLSPMLTRELARLSAMPDSEQEQRDLVRTLELVYWLIGLLIGAGIIVLSPWLARQGVHARTLSAHEAAHVIAIIGVVMVFQWPDSFYSGGLMGLQRQVPLNAIRIFTATLQSFGAVFILRFVACTVQAYFQWMIAVWAIQTLLLVACLWSYLPQTGLPGRFRRELWRKNAQFTKGMTGIALTTVLLSQSDKLVLTKYLSLEAFVYYILAFNLANTLGLLFAPIYNTVFPRFSQLVALKEEAGLAQFYHRSCQLVSLVVLPVTVMGVLFARPLLTLYLHDARVVQHVYPLFCLLLIGTAFNGIVTLPYALQIAYGWTQLSAVKNLLALAIVLPLLWHTVRHYGAIGGCAMILTTNIGYFLLEIPIMHRRLLPREMTAWYIRDVGVPLAISLVVGALTRLITPTTLAPPLLVLWITLMAGAAMLATLLTMPWLRATFRRQVQRL